HDGEEVQVSPPRKVTVDSGQAVRVAALAGLGIVLQPRILLDPDVARGDLVRLFPDQRLAERPMWLIYCRDRRMTPRLRSFIAFTMATFGAATAEAPEPPRPA
ncbi:MAG: LysR family transcriptional regulator, partial [Phyllobacteriaceae bacterium]|nr:LysR family transcriptional regulator [Phyllobacteriaceae bacterium]